MQISEVKVHVVPMSASWLSEGVIAKPHVDLPGVQGEALKLVWRGGRGD